ncbi:hypothetical protein CRG98_026686 [Punica granatum]|uniref:Uncharacterized protein n=1 Tax=Punica granatum TaxID=22663 RepID=A0A2I0J9C9_PUNGR|nr:hypothetical protein CRG98_026686 [Punica granatum]
MVKALMFDFLASSLTWRVTRMSFVKMPMLALWAKLDLRDDKQFFLDHPGAVPITTAQVRCSLPRWFCFLFITVMYMPHGSLLW